MKDKILIAMSGGVDSSAAALIMKSKGFDCHGITMRLCSKYVFDNSCLKEKDIEDAKSVCDNIGISFETVDFSDDFEKCVIDNFVKSYENGFTPNPCIECNFHLKFDKLYEYGLKKGYSKIATGHYARICYDEKYRRIVMKKATDTSKDQSYVLWRISKDKLNNIVFPLGEMTKHETREKAKESGLCVSEKHDSQDICFIPDGDYASFIENYSDKRYSCGNFITKGGKVLGTHKGIIRYTIGQRKGLGLALPRPMYVCEKRVDTNEIVLGYDEDLYSKELFADEVNLTAVDTIGTPARIKAKIRYNQAEQDATAVMESGVLHVVFDKPQMAICKGQSVVLYDGDTVIGGGKIIGVK